MSDHQSLLDSVASVRERMARSLETDGIDPEVKRELALALQELDVLWDELRKQAALFVQDNQRYVDFFEFAPDAYVITDAAGEVLQANQAAAELLAVGRAELVGRPLSGCLRPEVECSALPLGGERRCWLLRAAS